MPTTDDTKDDEEQPQDDALQGFWHYYLSQMGGGGGGDGPFGGLLSGLLGGGGGGIGGLLGGGLLPSLLSYGGTKKYQQGLADKKAATASNPAAPATPAVAQAQPQTPQPATSSQAPSNTPQPTNPMAMPSGVPGGVMSGSNGAPMPGMAAPIKLPPPQSAGMAALGQFGALQNQNPAAQNTRQAAGMATGNAASVGIQALLKKLLASRGM